MKVYLGKSYTACDGIVVVENNLVVVLVLVEQVDDVLAQHALHVSVHVWF